MSSNAHPSFSSVDIKSSAEELPHVDATINSKPLEGRSNQTSPDVKITDSPQAGSEIQADGQRPFTTALVHDQGNYDETVKGEKLHVDATSDLIPVEDQNNQTSPRLESVHSSLAGSQIQASSQPPSCNASIYFQGSPENQSQDETVNGLGQQQNTGLVNIFKRPPSSDSDDDPPPSSHDDNYRRTKRGMAVFYPSNAEDKDKDDAEDEDEDQEKDKGEVKVKFKRQRRSWNSPPSPPVDRMAVFYPNKAEDKDDADEEDEDEEKDKGEVKVKVKEQRRSWAGFKWTR